MAKWKYKTTIVDLDAVLPPEMAEAAMRRAGGSLDALEKTFDEEGEHEWELIQAKEHGGKLLCVWKKEMKETFAS